MPVKHPFLLYLRSRLNLWVSAAAAGLIIAAAVFLGSWLLAAAILVLFAYLVATFLLFFSHRGAREVVEESEQDRMKKVREKIDYYARMREQIAVLRVGDEAMRKSLEYFLLESGAYIEKCRQAGLYSPRANKRIEDALEICQAFLGELDESSTEKRYGVRDGESFEEFAKRSVDAVMAAGSDIKEWTTEDLIGLSAQDRLSIIEELEGKK
jgi:hypothetical protein